ncbi:hypothetical protein IKG20_00425 [Candidatus Saccharibacteria bacterium]|nr:hypothetical protein [Candidatus Saccharibacteria bacterium]
MRPRLKTFLLSFLCLGLIFGSLFIFKKPQSAASYSFYESLRIAPSSLNGNSIWGGGETFDTIVSAGALDDWAAFYSATNKASGGVDPSGSLSINGVPYQLSWTGAGDFNGNDTIRLFSGHESTTITLDTIGAYEKLYVLGTAGGPGEGNYANFAVLVHYTDGTSDETDYRLYDWYDATPVSGVYKWPGLARRIIHGTTTGYGSNKTTTYNYEGTTTGAPYLQSATISVNPKKLVSSVDLVLTGRNGKSSVEGIFCGIYAITGMVNTAAPNPVEVIYVDDVTETTADIRWEAVPRATSYRLDIALDPSFKNILPAYNNLLVNDISLVAEGLTGNTTYYTRVRAENSEGQSISSNVVPFTTDPETVPPSISVIANPGLIQIQDDAVIIAVDASGVKEISESLDGGETWSKLVDGDRAERTITENGVYCYRATDNYDNTSDKTCVTYSNLDTAKPIIRVNTNGYAEGEWTANLVTLTVESLSINVGETKYYYSEDGTSWHSYSDGIVVNEETGLEGKTYYFKAISQAGIESDVESVLVRRDITAPTGEITSADNSWNSFLNTITFGLFFNETKDFSVTASDELSGLNHIEYLVSKEKFDSKESALAASGWSNTSGTVAINPEGDFILYYKLVDKVGNASVINTDGVVLDTTNALIQGYVDASHTYPLEDGETYYLTQKLIVSDDRALGSVKVNGVETDDTIINLSANQTYAITATDKAGNVTNLTIKTGSLNSLRLDITEENFKTSDADTLEAAKAKLEEIETAEGDHASVEEHGILDDLEVTYQQILDQIADLKAEVKDEHDRSVTIPDATHVTQDDYETIQNIINDINSTLDSDGQHLTVEETNTLLTTKRELEDKLRVINEVAASLETLEIVNHSGTDIIKTSDKAELKDLKETAEDLLAGTNLTNDERETVETELDIIEELLDQISEAISAETTNNIQGVTSIIPTGYLVSDQEKLEAAKTDVESALNEFGNNYTDSEREALEQKLSDINSALDDIENQIWEETRRTTFPTLSVISDTEKWIPFDVAGVSATDEYGITSIDVSTDGGATWKAITTLESGTLDVTENGSYIFRAVNEFGNEKRQTVEYHNIDSVKPVVDVDSHGYVLGAWTNQPVTLTARNVANNLSPVTIYYREKATVDGESDWRVYSSQIVRATDTSSSIYEFKAISAAGLESDTVTAEIKKDSVVPTGTIITGNNSLNAVLNAVTFGLFFNETKTYEMDATDDRSGISSIKYIVSSIELDSDALKSSNDWQTTDGTVSVDPDKSTNIYYRLMDHAGNISVVSLSGVVFDLPGLSSVDVTLETKESGYSTLTTGSGTIELIRDLEHTTVDDLPRVESIKNTLDDYLENHPSSDSSVVEDLAIDYEQAIAEINETETKVQIVEESYSLVKDIDHVTSSDEEQIEALISAIHETQSNNSNHLTTSEALELEEMLDSLGEKFARIEEVRAELSEVDEAVNGYSIDTVNKEDLPALNELKEEINTLIDSTNVTEQEKEHLEELLEIISDLEERIAEAEKAIEEAKENDHSGSVGPNNVTPDDQTTLEDALSGYTDALGVFDSNLSLSDLFNINSKINIISSALDILDQVAEFESLISRLPNPEEVNYNSRMIVKAAESAYEALSEYGRTLVGPSLLAKYRAVLDSYRAYLEGSPLLYAFETLDVFWWGLATFVIVGIFIVVTKRTHRRYVETDDDKLDDDF